VWFRRSHSGPRVEFVFERPDPSGEFRNFQKLSVELVHAVEQFPLMFFGFPELFPQPGVA